MAEELSRSAKRIQDALNALGAKLEVVELPSSTRTSAEAAGAIGCSIKQIAKSIIFRTVPNGKPIMVIASGPNRVNEEKVREIIGEAPQFSIIHDTTSIANLVKVNGGPAWIIQMDQG
jgi:prolyl-tRNA editing enzyme YbaK/EbsC (Cys-tRNA(Pro) deacylase)